MKWNRVPWRRHPAAKIVKAPLATRREYVHAVVIPASQSRWKQIFRSPLVIIGFLIAALIIFMDWSYVHEKPEMEQPTNQVQGEPKAPAVEPSTNPPVSPLPVSSGSASSPLNLLIQCQTTPVLYLTRDTNLITSANRIPAKCMSMATIAKMVTTYMVMTAPIRARY